MSHISFIAVDKECLDNFPHPKPASTFIPNWFKDMPALVGDKKYIGGNGNPNSTVKRCVPFRDMMTAGYMIPLPCDVYFRQNGKMIEVNSTYAGKTDIVLQHEPEQHFMYPLPEEYYPIAFKWNNPWTIKTKKGWSTLFLHPSHHDLPFQTLSGLVDTDKHPIPVCFVFFVRKNFEGIIPKGTPIAQCIPIKREKFLGMVSYNANRIANMWIKATTQAFDRYRDWFHTPKSYIIKDEKATCPFAKLFGKK